MSDPSDSVESDASSSDVEMRPSPTRNRRRAVQPSSGLRRSSRGMKKVNYAVDSDDDEDDNNAKSFQTNKQSESEASISDGDSSEDIDSEDERIDLSPRSKKNKRKRRRDSDDDEEYPPQRRKSRRLNGKSRRDYNEDRAWEQIVPKSKSEMDSDSDSSSAPARKSRSSRPKRTQKRNSKASPSKPRRQRRASPTPSVEEDNPLDTITTLTFEEWRDTLFFDSQVEYAERKNKWISAKVTEVTKSYKVSSVMSEVIAQEGLRCIFPTADCQLSGDAYADWFFNVKKGDEVFLRKPSDPNRMDVDDEEEVPPEKATISEKFISFVVMFTHRGRDEQRHVQWDELQEKLRPLRGSGVIFKREGSDSIMIPKINPPPRRKTKQKQKPKAKAKNTRAKKATKPPKKSKRSSSESDERGYSGESDEEVEDKTQSDDTEFDSDDWERPSVSVTPEYTGKRVEQLFYRMQLPVSIRDVRQTFLHFGYVPPHLEPLIEPGKVSRKLWDSLCTPHGSPVATKTRRRFASDSDSDSDESDKENSRSNEGSQNMDVDGEDDIEMKDVANEKLVDKYLVKYLNESYHHLEWITAAEIEGLDQGTKVKNFNKKFDEDPDFYRMRRRIDHQIAKKDFVKVHFFNSLYLTIDRIIEQVLPDEDFFVIAKQTSSGNVTVPINNTSDETLFLVLWRSLEYSFSTFETESFVQALQEGNDEIELFQRREELPRKELLIPATKRPTRNRIMHRPPVASKVEATLDQVYKGGHSLRYYQVDGVNWLAHNWHVRTSCILADEMGLGKTVQTATFVNYIYSQHNIRGPFLIVAPLSTLGHWRREFRGWTDMNVIVYHGSQSSRKLAREKEWKWLQLNEANSKRAKNNWKFEVLVTTKEVISKDVRLLKAIHWHCIIVDEAHGLKSQKSLFYRNLNSYNRDHTLLLTGTPIQNNMQELFSLLHFMNPELYDDEEAFLDKYSQEKLSDMKDELQEELKRVILQRHKSLVEKDLLGREEKIIWVELTFFQKKWYRAIYDKSYEALRNIGSQRTSLMNVSMQLRKCCNHPFLLTDAEATMSPMGTTEIDICENLIKASGKLVLLDKLLPKLKKEGHRVLIFSQMSRVLEILEDYLEYRSYQYEKFDGSVTGTERQEAIDRFTADEDIFAFLLTTRAGGVGINLMAADTVIIFDSDWNPMNDLQAIARAHRIGQKKKVCVYRLIVRNSYEESMFRKADKKMALNEVVMGDIADMTKDDVGDMLKMGAIAVYLKDSENNAAIESFTNASIDDILESRVETVNTNEEVPPEKALFSEAFFAAEEEAPEIDIRDSNFWDRIGLKAQKERERYGRGHRRRGEAAKYKFSDASGSEYSSEEDEDEGTVLLECLATYPWGDWERMYRSLSGAEKAALGIVALPESPSPKPTPDDEKEVDPSVTPAEPTATATATAPATATTPAEPSAVEESEAKAPSVDKSFPKETKRTMYEAAVETVSAMLQLMKPAPREQILKKLEGVLYSRDFRMDVISTLARQIHKSDGDNPQSPIKKALHSRVAATEEKTTANGTENGLATTATEMPNIGSLNVSAPPLRKCKFSCGRSVNPENRDGDRIFDTCCKHCADTPPETKSKERPHQVSCDQRNRREFIERIERSVAQRISSSVSNDKSTKHRIRTELSKHDTEELLMRVSMNRIDNKALKRMLKSNEYGDVKQILLTIEQMSVLKMMSHELSVEKLEVYGRPPMTKTLPVWWSNKLDVMLIHETCKHGWGKLDQSIAQRNGFSLQYDVQEERVKQIKLDLSRPVQQPSDSKDPEELPDAPTASSSNSTDVVMNDATTNGTSPKKGPEMEVVTKRKTRKWLTEPKQVARLKTIVIHGRKLLKDRFKNYRKAIKTGKQRLLKPGAQPKTGVKGAVNGLAMLMQSSGDRPQNGKKKQSKLSTLNGSATGDVEKKKKKYKDLEIRRDGAGNVVMPVSVSKTMFLVNLGEIDPDPKFHTATKIYPIGYRVDVCKIASTCRPGKFTTYTTTIERGENGPKFVVTASDNRELRIEGSSAKSSWNKVVDLIEKLDPNAKTQKKSTGTKRIGFHHPDILKLIEGLPNARQCVNYTFQRSEPVLVHENGVVEILDSPPPPSGLESTKKKKKSKSRTPEKKKRKKSNSPKKMEISVSSPAPNNVANGHDAAAASAPQSTLLAPPVMDAIDLCSDSPVDPSETPSSELEGKKKKKRRLSHGESDEPEKKKRRTSPKKTKKQLKLDQNYFARS